MAIGRVDDVGLNEEVVADEIGAVRVVRDGPADPRGRQEHVRGPLAGKELLDGILPAQVELLVGAHDEVPVLPPR